MRGSKVTRGECNGQMRPINLQPLHERRSVDTPWHLYVANDEITVDTGIEKKKRLVAACRLDYAIATLAQDVGNRYADENLILNEENDPFSCWVRPVQDRGR